MSELEAKRRELVAEQEKYQTKNMNTIAEDVRLYIEAIDRIKIVFEIQDKRTKLEHGADVSLYAGMDFTAEQMKEIREGLEHNLDVSTYADRRFKWDQMRQIRMGLEKGAEVSIYADAAFNPGQMYEIREGLEHNLDVSIYATSKFTSDQMEQIRKGLEQGIDVSIYADTDFNSKQMFVIRRGLAQGLDASIYAKPEFDFLQMSAIFDGLEQGLDASIYADNRFNFSQMEEIRKGLEQGLDASLYANPQLDSFQMQEIRESLIKEMNSGDISAEEAIGKSRLLIDMDGTLAKFKPVDTLETLYEEGYFRNLEPLQNVVDAIKEIIHQYPKLQVYIMSSVLADSKYAMLEKNEWLDKYLPEISIENRIFPPCGEDKLNYVPGGIRITDYLLDDYTHNLSHWEPPAKGIKLLNGINHTNKTWQGNMLRYDKEPGELAQNIIDIISSKALIQDVQPQNQEKKNVMQKRKLEARGPKL